MYSLVNRWFNSRYLFSWIYCTRKRKFHLSKQAIIYRWILWRINQMRMGFLWHFAKYLFFQCFTWHSRICYHAANLWLPFLSLFLELNVSDSQNKLTQGMIFHISYICIKVILNPMKYSLYYFDNEFRCKSHHDILSFFLFILFIIIYTFHYKWLFFNFNLYNKKIDSNMYNLVNDPFWKFLWSSFYKILNFSFHNKQ